MTKLDKKTYWSNCIVALTLGASLYAMGTFFGGASHFTFGSQGLNFHHWFSGFTVEEYETERVTITDEVVSIQLDSQLGEVRFRTGDTLSLTYQGDVSHKITGNRLEIDGKVNLYKYWWQKLEDEKIGFIEITIPDTVTSLDIESSGIISLTDLDLADIEIETNLGNVQMEDTSVKKGKMTADMGNISLTSCTFDNLVAELDMGNLTTENLTIDVSGKFVNNMGNMEIGLAEVESNYNFHHKTNFGAFSINGRKTSASVGSVIITTETDMGAISITTK
ncbi:MAG: DUF4097 family beta strand repeat-containing protein [Eubacteriales bacterium]